MNPSILFVDDDRTWCEILSLYFAQHGFDVTTALTGAEARAIADKNQFHLAILDVNLNGESGLDLLDSIKTKSPNLPVLMFTGLDVNENLVKQSLRGRAQGILPKLQSLESLLATVRWHVAKTEIQLCTP